MANTVLIVEDDVPTCMLWSKYLSFYGWTVQSVASAEEAEAILAKQLPSVVILDINLASEINGWELLAKWRASTQTERLPVFIVSTLDEPRRAIQAGATGFLLKPCSPQVLISQITQDLPVS